jgi:hypothetical protein
MATPNIVYDRLIVQHIRNRSSRYAVPDRAFGMVDRVWGAFFRALDALGILLLLLPL